MYKKILILFYVCFYSLFVMSQAQIYFNNIYSYNGNYTIGMTILDKGDGYVGYGATDDIGIYQMLFLYKISYTGEMQILKTYYEPNTTFYPGNVGGAMIQTSDNNFALAFNYTGSGNSYGSLMKLNTDLDTIWKKNYTPSYITNTLNCIQTLDNGYLLTGWVFQSEEDFSDAILLKTDSLGNYQWHQLYGGIWAEHGEKTVQTPDGGYLIGGYFWKPGYDHSLDAMVIKTDSLGNEEWTQYYGNPDVDDDMALVAMAWDGDYLVVTVYGEWIVSPATRTGRIYLVKVNNEGTTIWQKKIGPKMYHCNVRNIRETNDGNFITTGFYYSDTISEFMLDGLMYKFTQEGDSIWMRDYYYYHNQYDINMLYDAYPTSDNGYIAIGKARPNIGGATNKMWIVKVDSLGCDTPGCNTGVNMFEWIAEEKGELKVWPNPTTGQVTLSLSKCEPTAGKEKYIRVYNSQGLKVEEIEVPDGVENLEVDVSKYTNGLYYLQYIHSNQIMETVKFIKN